MSKTQFVSPGPDDAAPTAAVSGILVREGVEPRVAARVAALFLCAADVEDGDDGFDADELEPLLVPLAQQLRDAAGTSTVEDAAVLHATLVLAAETGRSACWNHARSDVVRRACGHLATLGRDLSGALEAVLATPDAIERLRWTGVGSALLNAGLVDPSRFVDRAAIRATTKGVPGHRWNQATRERDPLLPDFWVVLDPARAIASCAELLKTEPAETLGQLALGLERSLSLRYRGPSESLRPLVAPLASVLCERRRDEALEHDRTLTRCCWAYCQLVPDTVLADREALRELALAELGRMRGVLRGADDAAQFAGLCDYLSMALSFVLRTDSTSLWGVLRRLLLALRELRNVSVPPDLRTWSEPDRDPIPEPWGWVPSQIATTLELFLGRELERDPGLAELRASFAVFLLERLKSRSRKPGHDGELANSSFVERDPVWRLGYLHAIQALHVNPGGRGHKVLAWSMRSDPDAEVRAEAKRAHRALRRSGKLPDGVSPRRAVYTAFWWLRQSHLLSLGFEPDEAGAQRTLRKEVRRVRELDHQT